jgi:hypothetical protein
VKIYMLVLTTFGLIFSQEADAKTINLATMSEGGGPYEISFCGRPSPNSRGFPGHAFVSFSKGTGASRVFRSLGLTVGGTVSPVSAAMSFFGPSVSGIVTEENFTHIRQECLSVIVNKADFDRAYSQALPLFVQLGVSTESTLRTEAYKLGENDCITFAYNIAAALKPAGLNVPKREMLDRPIGYIQKLQNQN